ncbi:MAG: acyltransferase family protein [Anaerolineae bacterium]|nr:acyltransferase family protein [Anaerolineae bacterium]
MILYYLVSPFLAPLARKRPWLLLGVGSVVLLAGITSGYVHFLARMNQVDSQFLSQPASYLLERQVFEYFFYYVAGFTAGFHQAQLKAVIHRLRWVLLGGLVVMAAAMIMEAEWVYQTTEMTWWSRTLTLPSALYAISFILTFLAFEKLELPVVLYHIGVNTLGIYLIHKTVLLVAPKIVYHVLPAILGMQIVYQPLLIALGAGLPLLLMLIIRKTPLRKFYRVLFG